MKLVLSPEQEELRATVRRFLEEQSPMSHVRAVLAGGEGYDRALWTQMAGQLGLAGIAIPETYGGAGYGQVEVSVVMEELGRSLAQTPFLSTSVLAVNALLHSDDETARTDLLPRIASGDLVATVAVAEAGVGWNAAGITAIAEQSGADWKISGAKTAVVDGDLAEQIIVVARAAGGGLGFYLVAGDAEGLTRTPLETMDPTRRLARLELVGTPARQLTTNDAQRTFDTVTDLARIALAAEQAGGLEHCMRMTTEYARTRIQFGRPIGTFQAVKHGCANMYVEWELAYSALRYAAWVPDEAPDELPLAASLASDYIGQAYAKVSADTIQLHGGIGFTWEHDAHFYYKRAQSDQSLFGDRVQRRTQLADRLGL